MKRDEAILKMKEEIWKDYDEKYKVSSYGKVWNKIRNIECKVYIHKVGYYTVSIHGKTTGVHRMVALTFIPNPENKPTVNHIDANKGNNHIDNLEWATHKEQSQHVSKNRLHKKSKWCCEIDSDNTIIDIFPSMSVAQLKHNIVMDACVYKCCEGVINTYKDYRFRYYDENTKDWIRTDYDLGLKKPKGKYSKKIYCGFNDKVYDNQMSCAKDLGIDQSMVSRVLLGKETKNKYNIKYLD